MVQKGPPRGTPHCQAVSPASVVRGCAQDPDRTGKDTPVPVWFCFRRYQRFFLGVGIHASLSWKLFKGCRPVPPTLRWGASPGFFVLSAAFGWFRLAGLLARSLACLFACFQRFSRPHSFAHSEHQPKECYIESRQLSVPRAQPARTASRPARLEAALASLQRARTKGVRRQPAPPRPSA